MIRKIINGMVQALKWLLYAAWVLVLLAIVIGIPYRIMTVGWDEFVRPAMESVANEMKPSLPHE